MLQLVLAVRFDSSCTQHCVISLKCADEYAVLSKSSAKSVLELDVDAARLHVPDVYVSKARSARKSIPC